MVRVIVCVVGTTMWVELFLLGAKDVLLLEGFSQ
jgi:hypothetical protein